MRLRWPWYGICWPADRSNKDRSLKEQTSIMSSTPIDQTSETRRVLLSETSRTPRKAASRAQAGTNAIPAAWTWRQTSKLEDPQPALNSSSFPHDAFPNSDGVSCVSPPERSMDDDEDGTQHNTGSEFCNHPCQTKFHFPA